MIERYSGFNKTLLCQKKKKRRGKKGNHSEVIVFETFPLAENNCCGFP